MKMKMVKLSEVCEINIGKTPSRSKKEFWGKGFTWLSIADLGIPKYVSTSKEEITKLGIEKSNCKIVPKGTLLFSFKLSIGKIAVTDKDLYTNEAIVALPIKDKTKLDWNYLYHVLSIMDFAGVGDKAVKGITLNKAKLKELEIPLPSLPTQQKIAAILDRADALRQKDKQLLVQYDALAQSVFYTLFGDPVKNERGLDKGTIRDLVSEVKYGTSKPAENEGEFPYLRMNNITYSGAFDFTDLKYINLEEKEKEKYLVRNGDLLFNRTNSKELVGKTAVYKGETEMAIAGYLIRVRTNERANTEYISAYLNSSHGKMKLMSMCKSIVGMANINAQELQDIPILIPPIELQTQFATIISKIEEQKHQATQQLQKSEELFQSLLQKAFKGELVE